jgi:hypothetical protein
MVRNRTANAAQPKGSRSSILLVSAKLESAAEWSAIGPENRGVRNDGRSIRPLSAIPPLAQLVEVARSIGGSNPLRGTILAL